MKTADRFQRSNFFAKRAGRNHFIPNRFRQKTVWVWATKKVKEHHHVLEHVTMLLFMTTLCLGAFYLFLVQLAENGW